MDNHGLCLVSMIIEQYLLLQQDFPTVTTFAENISFELQSFNRELPSCTIQLLIDIQSKSSNLHMLKFPEPGEPPYITLLQYHTACIKPFRHFSP
jgi:hypothetical protein